MSESKTFIIIVTFNGIQWIQKCIQSILTKSSHHQIIVVDNNSSDNTVEFLRENYPSIFLFELDANLGFGSANNIGISLALKKNADYVFLLNQDAYLEFGCVETLTEVHKNNNEFGILSPIHLDGPGNRLDWKFANYINYNSNKDFYSDYVLNKPKKEIYELPFINAAGWLISRECLLTVGGFDPIFFHYGEDDNYCQRLKYHGFKIGIVPKAKLKHDRVQSERRMNNKEIEETLLWKKERNYKIRYANINTDNLKSFRNLKYKRKKAAIRSFIKLNFVTGKKYWAEANLIDRISPEIKRSIELNKLKAPTYLKL
ncbi:glycosyltransferase family 2 protein [Gramella sp. BOM4]|nr:glycosyltransferase family 2 protein [Christiangramia bathymodioli]